MQPPDEQTVAPDCVAGELILLGPPTPTSTGLLPVGPSQVPADGPSEELTLVQRLERRQDQVLAELELLDARISNFIVEVNRLRQTA